MILALVLIFGVPSLAALFFGVIAQDGRAKRAQTRAEFRAEFQARRKAARQGVLAVTGGASHGPREMAR